MAGFAPAPLPSLSLVLGENHTLTAAAGSFALSGQAATFDYGAMGRSENPAPLPHIGLNLGPVTGYTGTSDAGAFVLSGTAAGLYVKRPLVCAAGSYALTGQDATLTKIGVNSVDNPAPLPHLSLVLGGAAGVYSMPGAAGAFSLTGVDAALRRGIGLISATGAFVWSGAPAERDLEMNGDAGAFVIAGQDATAMATHHPLTAEVGAFVLTGYAASLDYSGADKVMAAFVGTFDVTGNDAAMDYGLAIQCEAGGFVVTANDVSYETTGTFEGASGEGWRGVGGEDDDDPWWMRLPVKPMPAKVERAINAAAKASPYDAQAILEKKVKRAGEEWDADYAVVLSAMQASDAESVAALRQQIQQQVMQENVVRLQLRDEEDVAIALLLAA